MATWQHPLPGSRLTPGRGFSRSHTGIDLSYGSGTCGRRVVAAAPGFARRKENIGGGHGVVIDHGSGVESGYWHLGTQLVPRQGRQVRAGELIGLAGASGTLVSGCHLHLELKINGANVDPSPIVGGQAVRTAPELALGESMPEAAPGTYPDVLGSGGGRCNVAEGWRDASALETFARPELTGYCVRVDAGSIAGGIVTGALGEALPVLTSFGVIIVALIIGWSGMRQVLGIR